MNAPLLQQHQIDERLVAVVTCPQFLGATDGGVYHFVGATRSGRDAAYAYALELAVQRVADRTAVTRSRGAA